jgi:integrase
VTLPTATLPPEASTPAAGNHRRLPLAALQCDGGARLKRALRIRLEVLSCLPRGELTQKKKGTLFPAVVPRHSNSDSRANLAVWRTSLAAGTSFIEPRHARLPMSGTWFHARWRNAGGEDFPFTTAGFGRMIERAAAAAGLSSRPIPHMLRHACGYALANKGHDTRAKGWLGHRSITSTAVYTAGLSEPAERDRWTSWSTVCASCRRRRRSSSTTSRR